MTISATPTPAGTLLLDFDSTLIELESLEAILKPALAANPALEAKFQAITRAGMEGRMDFGQSLRERLRLARPTRAEVSAFGREAVNLLTPGMPAMIESLRRRAVTVRIASGGLLEAILPSARALGIPEDHVHAVRPRWDASGSLLGMAPDDRFHISKVEGLKSLVNDWPRPIVIVGDGMTDHQIGASGLADCFIAFTQHVQRAAVIATGAPVARDVDQLTRLLEELL